MLLKYSTTVSLVQQQSKSFSLTVFLISSSTTDTIFGSLTDFPPGLLQKSILSRLNQSSWLQSQLVVSKIYCPAFPLILKHWKIWDEHECFQNVGDLPNTSCIDTQWTKAAAVALLWCCSHYALCSHNITLYESLETDWKDQTSKSPISPWSSGSLPQTDGGSLMLTNPKITFQKLLISSEWIYRFSWCFILQE